MQRFWWVNHKQTVRQEVGGGFLWAPKREAGGSRSHFYDNMRRAAPGDMVVSFAHSHVSFIGVVTDHAISAPKPVELEKVAYWEVDGWLLPVEWHPVPAPVRPKEFLAAIQPYLPEKYSPINAETGGGNQKAYLAEIDKRIFEIIVMRCQFVMPEISTASSSKSELIEAMEDAVQETIEADTTLDATEKEQAVKARVGQGKYRKNVYKVERRCRVTHVDNPSLLIASHIKPWRACETAAERLDGNNGLLLTPHVDHLFDAGFISFADDGTILVSKKVPQEDLRKIGLLESCKTKTGAFSDEQKKYLAYHRELVFLRD